jgi:chromosome segregation protein
MRIIRISIHGFKTFARATEFVFDPGITAVVGPNGSGKSNIVDAMRWCLGEQSFSLLRSKKTSDVIFAGSDKRPRLGMAEVTITLDNSNGEIPLDYSEVEVTRRAYRDGDNEYLVNGQRVRLQDVVELLSQTGLGKRTYSVVGQGLIDRALSMAPEERRSLFEEAAGITGYQIKRTTAMRRLEATEANLTRVHDIVAELSPRLGYMKRQAERAREREQIAADLQAVLRDWYGFRWHTTLRQLEANHGTESAARAAVTARQGLLADVSMRIDMVQGQQRQLRASLADLHAAGAGLHRQAETVGRELAVAQERLRQLQARQEDARRELSPLHHEQESLVAHLAELQAAVAEAQAAHAVLQAAADALQAEVGQRQEARQALVRALEAARTHLRKQQDQQADAASRVTQLGERRSILQAELARYTASLEQALGESTAAMEALRAAEVQAGQVDERATSLQADRAALERGIEALRGQLRDAEETRRAADRALDRLHTRQDLLSRLREEGAGYGSGVRGVLSASGGSVASAATGSKGTGRAGGPLRGILGTVASLLRVPSHLEKAIETALGGALQNVVTERWDDASAAIEYLKQQRGGRATFLPLDRLSVLPAITAPRSQGILGNAADLVEYDAAVAPAMQQLLNRVWVAETLPAARAALDKFGGGARPTVVTLEGEIVRPGGAVTGGSDNMRGDDSLLARERELRELPRQIERSSQEARRAAAACGELARQIEAARLGVEEHQRTLAELARQERQERQAVEELRRRSDRAVQAHRWQAERCAQIEAELAALQEHETTLQASLGGMEGAVGAALAAVAGAEADLAAARADELLQELGERRAAAAGALGQLHSRQALLDSSERSRRNVADQIEAKRRQIEGLEGEIERLGEQVAVLSKQEADLSAEIAVLQAQIDPIEAQLLALDAGLAEEQTLERSLQAALRKEETVSNAAQLHLQRSQDLLQQLRGEIEQDLGLVALEQSEDIAYQPPLPWDAFVKQLPVVESIPDGMDEEVRDLRARLARLGGVNPEAPREYEEAAGRHEFLLVQSGDLEAALADLRKIIGELDERMEVELRRTYDAVGKEFTRLFAQLFNGGTAHLELTDPDHIGTSGIEIIARPPGKRPQSLALLSGGERSLSACALIFAILRVSPTPFCVLDEVDAALDEANIDRFRLMLEDMSKDTQFIIVTHNRRTLEGANTIYGVTMGNDGISRVMSLRLEGDKILTHNDSGADDAAPPEIVEVVEM